MRDRIARLRGALFVLWARLFRPSVSIGPGLRIYRKLRVYGAGKIEIGSGCRIAGIAGDPSQYVCLDTHSSSAVIRIGDNARLCAARIAARYQVTIDDDVLIEEAGIVDTDFHSIEKGRDIPAGESLATCAVAIGKRVSIGARSYITKGVTIGDGAVICPGAIVSSSVRPGSVVIGNPARPVVVAAAGGQTS